MQTGLVILQRKHLVDVKGAVFTSNVYNIIHYDEGKWELLPVFLKQGKQLSVLSEHALHQVEEIAVRWYEAA